MITIAAAALESNYKGDSRLCRATRPVGCVSQYFAYPVWGTGGGIGRAANMQSLRNEA